MSDLIFGVHPVLELLRGGGDRVARLFVAAGRGGPQLGEILAAARAAGVAVLRQPEAALDRMAPGVKHQGVIARVGAAEYADAAEVVAAAPAPALFVVLDGVDDPRNLGAVIRSAAAAGAHGVFLPERRAAGLTGTTVKAAAGATEKIPVARIGNVVSFLQSLKERGVWVVGLDPSSATPWTGFDLTSPVALVVGGEGAGLRRLARETCDVLLSIPLAGGVESLNLSVAAAIALFEAVRQRRKGAGGGPRGSVGRIGGTPD